MKKLLLLFIVFTAIQFNTFAERINIPGLEIPKLIITEVRPDAPATTYVELTNVGDVAIDLAPFTLHSVHYNTRCREYSDSVIFFWRTNPGLDATIGKVYLEGVLQPGESFVVANVWDANNSRGSGIPNHNIAIAQIANQFAHINEEFNYNGWINMPEWQCYGKDSVSARPDVHIRAESTAGYLLHWVYESSPGNLDSTYIDQFNHFWFPEDNIAKGIYDRLKGYNIFPIAGVEDAIVSGVMIRKANVSKGNLNWDQSRGTDSITSEWLVLPKNTSKDLAFTTVGSHGKVYDLDYAAKNPSNIIVNETEGTISVPWQLVRGDSLSRHFNLGTGMTWSYDLVDSYEDSASYIVRTGDKFAFYAVGNDVKKKEFTLQVREPETNLALVFPVREILSEEFITKNESTGIIDTTYRRYWSEGFRYALSAGPEIDSIINIPFATRIDSLLKYLVKPDQAKYQFVFADGQERVDLQFGDKLKVTSEDGSNSKEYFIAVDDFIKSNDATLKTVTWPDIEPNQYPRWNKGDTLPDFTSLKTSYTVQLRQDAKEIPALQFIPENFRSKIKVENAININGNLEQRTTSVTVTSESDTVNLTYYFTFEKNGTPIQPNIAEPFISEMLWNNTTQGCAVEIFNPGTEDLDLSQYVYVQGAASQTWQEAVETLVDNWRFEHSSDGLQIYKTHYFPSKRWAADGSKADWSAIPDSVNPYVGKGFLKDDNQTNPWVKGGDVWVMGIGLKTHEFQAKIRQESDFIFRGAPEDGTKYAWDSTLILHRETPIWGGANHNMWLLKVLNDSILNGTKDVRDASQYELIDRIEDIGDTIAGRLVTGNDWSLIRKPHITKGSLNRIGGASSTPESSEWIVRKGTDVGVGNANMVANIGLHTMNPVTNYLSTVTSIKLIVTPGYSGDNLSITGNITDYTPTTIAAVLYKADASQTYKFMRANTEITADQPLADADVLVITSGDEKSITNYKLINSPLDNNTSLIAKAESGLTVTGNKVTGVTAGMTLKEALSKLEIAEKSILRVYDANGALQPLRVHNLDSIVSDVLVNEKISLEVVAENDDKAYYQFDFVMANNEAILLSNTLPIDQNKKVIKELPLGVTAPSLLTMVFANEGATIKIFDKAGFERTSGFMNIDDVLEVTAADGITKVKYYLMLEQETSIYKHNAKSSVKIFPNPVKHRLYIEGLEISTIDIYSLSGVKIISKSTYTNSIDVSKLNSGAYIIRLTDIKGNIAIDKFLKN